MGLGERGCNSLALGVGVRSIDTAGKGDGKEDCILTSPGWFSATNDEWLSVVRDCVGRLFIYVCVCGSLSYAAIWQKSFPALLKTSQLYCTFYFSAPFKIWLVWLHGTHTFPGYVPVLLAPFYRPLSPALRRVNEGAWILIILPSSRSPFPKPKSDVKQDARTHYRCWTWQGCAHPPTAHWLHQNCAPRTTMFSHPTAAP